MTKLPDTPDATPALLGGQAALFDDPTKLLTWEEGTLRTVAANLGKEGGSILAQLRRAAGLVAWAAWYRFPEATYREFAAGFASSLGIEVGTLRNWRRAVVSAETLPVPGVAAERAVSAAKGRKTAGQPGGALRSTAASDPIPAASTEAPAKQSEGVAQTGETPAEPWSKTPSGPSSRGARATAPPSQPGAPTDEAPAPLSPAPLDPPEEIDEPPLVDGETHDLIDWRAINAEQAPPRLPSDRQLAARVFVAMRAVDPTDAGPVTTPEEATFLRQWAQRTLDAWKAKHAPPAPAEKPQRRQGTITRPADRAKTNGQAAGSLTRRTVTPMFKP